MILLLKRIAASFLDAVSVASLFASLLCGLIFIMVSAAANNLRTKNDRPRPVGRRDD